MAQSTRARENDESLEHWVASLPTLVLSSNAIDDLDRLLAVLDECNAFDDTDLRIMKLPPRPAR